MAENKIMAAYSKFAVVGVVVGVLALLATMVSVVIVLREEKIEVAAQVMACDELTTYHPELEAKFTYAGKEVTHLWKLKVKFVNSGDKTIIGVGEQSDILGEGLNFEFPDNTRILRVEEEAETFQSNVTQVKPNHFQIQFSQWRSGEYSIVSFCIASDEPLVVDPFPRVPIIDNAPIRDIIDGDIIVEDLTVRVPYERMSLIDYFPRTISVPGKILGGISAGGLALLFFIILVWAWVGTIKKVTWKRQYISSFRIYLNRVEPKISKRRRELYIENPQTLPDNLWAKFEGKKASWDMDFPNKPSVTIITIILVFAVFGLSCLILMLLPV